MRIHQKTSHPSGNACTPGKPGLTDDEVRERIGEDRMDEFNQWMRGQTVGYCPGCGQTFTYPGDLARFILGPSGD